jgi:type I site-specific restriction endonuclease
VFARIFATSEIGTDFVNEAETRAEHIDPALAAAGWGVAEGSRIRREYPITLGRLEGAGKRGKPLTADYVLEYRNTKLAVVEAKAWDKALTEGVAQAKDYAYKLAVRFTYTSNGQGVYGIDMLSGTEGEVASYPPEIVGRVGGKGLWQGSTERNAEDHRRREKRPVRRTGACRLCPGTSDPRRAS